MWLTPTTNDLLASIGSAEATLLATKSASDSQDVQAQIMARSVNTVRTAVRRSGCTMGPDGTIPQEALEAWAEIAVAALFRRLNVELKASRIESLKEARAQLQRFATNEDNVVGYGMDEQTAGGQHPHIHPRRRTFGREREDGI